MKYQLDFQAKIDGSNLKLLYAVFVVTMFATTNDVCGEQGKPEKYCREKVKLNVSGGLDEYLLVDAEIDSIIILECKFCEDENKEIKTKIWYWKNLNQTDEPKEVELGMDNNATLNRILMSIDNALVIRGFSQRDAGIYFCLGADDKGMDKNYNYRLEPVFTNEITDEPIKEGDVIEYEKYQEETIVPVTVQLSTSEDPELVKIKEEGISLEVTTEWGRWSPCKECKDHRGVKKRKALCRIASYLDEKIENENKTSAMVDFFMRSPLIPCRSMLLDEHFPTVSNATRYLPEFVVTEKCKPCKKEKKNKKHKFKYKRRYVLIEGAHLSIACPEATVESNVEWRKDSLLLEKGKGHSFRKKDPEPRVLVDLFFTIYLKGVSKDEQGNYTCYVDDRRMMQARITVMTETKLLTQAFVRHFYFLSFVLFLASIGYCYGVVKTCKNRHYFRIQTYEELKKDKKLLDEPETDF